MSATTVLAGAFSAEGDDWERAGGAVAANLEGVHAAVVAGLDAERVARVALGLARVFRATRRVVVADLLGGTTPLSELAGGQGSEGLSDGFVNGQPLNEIARPIGDDDGVFVLPAGRGVIGEELLSNERWGRLARGFADAGALLLVAAPRDVPRLSELAASLGGIVAVDFDPVATAAVRVLASVRLPERAIFSPSAQAAAPARTRQALLVGVAFATALAIAALGWFVWRRLEAKESTAISGAQTAPSAGRAAASDKSLNAAVGSADADTRVRAMADTVRVAGVVNPADSAVAAAFAVEVVAANSVAGANSVLRDSTSWPGSGEGKLRIVVPVAVGSGVWHKVVVGAWSSRGAAVVLLDALRVRGILGREAGRVVRVPYALLLAPSLTRAEADSVVASWRARGVAAYALQQQDGSAHVFAGAFETTAEAAVLAAAVRDRGTQPVMAFRTGRAF